MIIRLLENINSVCGKYTSFKGEPMDVIKYDERLEIYHCKTRFTKDDSIVYEVCKECAEVVEQKPEQEKPTEENHRPFKIKITKIMPGMDHSGINLGDELYPITWGKDYYGVEVDSYRWVIPKEAAEVIETMPVEQKPEQQKPPSDYHLPNVFSQVKYFDYYMFARAQQAAGLVIDPELAHVQKKLFVPYRGHKSTKQDVIECIKTLQLWLENNEL